MSLTNRLKLLTSYFRNQGKVSHGPVEIGIEATNHCTLNCLMCNRQEMKRSLGFIDWNLFKKIVDQTSKTAEIYSLFGLGEPLLHPQIFKMIDYCHKKNVPVIISTNATVLTKEKATKLVDHSPDHLLLALPAFKRKTYNKITGGRHFNQVKKNILFYLKKRREKKLLNPAIVLFVKQKLNQDEVEKFKKYWQGKGATAVYIKPVTQMTNLTTKTTLPKSCLFPYRTFSVTWQGDVFPCCLDTNCSFGLGNVEEKSVKQIWQAKKWQKLRQSFKTGKLSLLCRSCSVFKPNLLVTVGMSLFSDLTVKKLAPYVNR